MNYYEILDVAQDADQAAIDHAWRTALTSCHPDRFARRPESEQQRAAERFKRVTKAHEVLSDPKARAEHDRTLAAAGAAPSPSAGPGPVATFRQVIGRDPTDRELRGLALLRATARLLR